MATRSASISFVCALVLAGTLAGCGGGSGGLQVASGFNVVSFPVKERKAAPAFEGTTLREGTPISSSLLAGKVGVVNFWGSWCGPCRREQGPLEQLWKQYQSRGVQFIGVNSRRDQKTAALAYIGEFDVTYPSVFNPDSSIAFDYRLRFMPATFVIDRQGKIAAEVIGALRSESDLRALIDSELS
ncbi:MAG: TlpA family protein disulfide reductase [Actinomycetota bacterium]